MVRKRGGVTGQGGAQGGGGGKRQATTPVGGTFKDPRRNIRGGEDSDDNEEEEWTHVVRNKPTIPEKPNIVEKLNKASSERGSIIAGTNKSKGGSLIDQLNERASIRGSTAGSVHGDNKQKNKPELYTIPESLYKTAPADGCMRDVITVVVQSKDGEDYRGTVTYTEARYEIFSKGMDLPDDLLHGIKIQFGNSPTITYKLTEQIDIDSLSSVEYFEFERTATSNSAKNIETFQCKIKGIRQKRPEASTSTPPNEEHAPNVFNVRIIGCDYSIEEEEILEWLKLYGETFGKLTENCYYDPRPEVKPVKDGTYTIRMRIDRQIPQFLPMYGKKVKIEHRSIQIRCTNCYGKHPRKVCKSEKVAWMDYVSNFMATNQDVTNTMIGKWYEIAMKEGRTSLDQQKEKPQATRRMSDEICKGSYNMQDAIQKVKEISLSRRETNTANANTRHKRHDKNDPEVLKEIISIRNESIDGERLYELTELGLSVDAAKDLVEREKELNSVYKMLDEKRKKEKLANNTKTVGDRPEEKKQTQQEKHKW